MKTFISYCSAAIQVAKPPVKTAPDDATAGASGMVGAARRVGVPPPTAVAPEPPPADHELGPGQASPLRPWYRRPGILIAAAALTAEIGIVVSGTGESGSAPGGITGTSIPWSPSFSLMTTDWWEPPPPPPPPPPRTPSGTSPSAGTPPYSNPNVGASSVGTPSGGTGSAPPPPPPPPPPPELVLRVDNNPGTAFVSITNNDKPAVGCMYRTVAVAGVAAGINWTRDVPLHRNRLGGDEDRSYWTRDRLDLSRHRDVRQWPVGQSRRGLLSDVSLLLDTNS